MAIVSTSNGHNVQPPPGPAEAPVRTIASELTDEQRGWLSKATRNDIDGWLHVTIKGSPAARGFHYGFLVAEEYAESIRVYREMTYQDIGNNGGYANSWLIGDVKTGEIARYEEGLLYQSLSRTTDGYFWGDNQPQDPRIRNLECFGTGFSDVRAPNGAREVRWRQLLGQYNGSIDAEVGKRMLGDTFDTYLGYIHPSARTICAHSDVDPCFDSGLTPFTPFGSVDGKVASSADIKALSLWVVSGRADGTEFDAEEFLRQHPQWDWQRGYLKDRPQQPWTHIGPGSTGGP